MKDFHRILRRGVVTEKSSAARANENAYTFVVDPDANKIEIRQAVEKYFGLKNKVLSVNTMNFDGKWRRKGRKGGYRPDWKKAVVTLVKGATIKVVDEG